MAAAVLQSDPRTYQAIRSKNRCVFRERRVRDGFSSAHTVIERADLPSGQMANALRHAVDVPVLLVPVVYESYSSVK